MKILNIGCGSKVSDSPDVINLDWSILIRLKKSMLGRLLAPFILDGARYEKFLKLPTNIVAHNLINGIPYPDNTFDVVYHSHVLEHIDKSNAFDALLENYRVLKLGGTLRVCVPDLEFIVKNYLHSLEISRASGLDICESHDEAIGLLLEQSVRREAFGSSQQPRPRRSIENFLLGDARSRGETHQWMYDTVNLGSLLRKVGFSQITIQEFNTSQVNQLTSYGLDEYNGSQYKPHSIYMEAIK